MKFFKRKKKVATDVAVAEVETAAVETAAVETAAEGLAAIGEEPSVVAIPEPVDSLPQAQAVPGPATVEIGQEVSADLQPEPAQLEAPDAASDQPDDKKQGFFSRLRHGLGRTSDNLVQGMGNLFLGRKEIDAELLEELESRLLLADVGVDATLDIIDRLT